MGVIQQSFNQAASVAGLANHLYQQSPGYQKKMEYKEYQESKKRYFKGREELSKRRERAKEGSFEREAIENTMIKMGEQRSNELFSRGNYVELARQEEINALNRAGHFGPFIGNQAPQAYDEQRAQAANQRAEDQARQIAEQNQRNGDIVRQLRGLLPLSQELVAKHKEGIK